MQDHINSAVSLHDLLLVIIQDDHRLCPVCEILSPFINMFIHKCHDTAYLSCSSGVTVNK